MTRESSSVASRADGTETWVAVIDDHHSMRSCLARALQLEGIHAELFASAEEFLDHGPASTPSCIILDLQLPGMQGHELAHYLERERPPAPPIIFISAHDDMLAFVGSCCERHGCLRKPFEIDALLVLMKQMSATCSSSGRSVA